MKRSLLTAIFALGLIGSASAADMSYPMKAPAAPYMGYDWTGLYIGANGGLGASDHATGISGNNPLSAMLVNTGVVPGSVNTRASGAVAGGQLGYNRQFGMWIVGAEVDAQWSNIKGSDTKFLTLAPLGLPVGVSTTASSSLEWYSSFVGKVGITPVDRLMLYAKAGGVVGGINNSVTSTLTAPAPFGVSAMWSDSATKFGYIVGAGANWAVTQNIVVGVDYSYLNFDNAKGSYGATVAGAPISLATSRDFDAHIVKATASYKLPY